MASGQWVVKPRTVLFCLGSGVVWLEAVQLERAECVEELASHADAQHEQPLGRVLIATASRGVAESNQGAEELEFKRVTLPACRDHNDSPI